MGQVGRVLQGNLIAWSHFTLKSNGLKIGKDFTNFFMFHIPSEFQVFGNLAGVLAQSMQLKI